MERDRRLGANPSVLTLASSCVVGDLDGAAREIVRRAAARGGGYVCLCNVHVVTVAIHRADVRRAVAEAWRRLPDGAPLAWTQRRLGYRNAQRIPGPDLMPHVVDVGREADLRHFLFGSTSDVTGRVRAVLEHSFPGARIVGELSPGFSAAKHPFADAVPVIRDASPDVVWCALGAPKQELWMQRYGQELDGAVTLGVGAAFDFLAARKQRAPAVMQRLGLEWLHRLWTEPARLGGRYVRTNSEFVARTAYELAVRSTRR